MDFGFFEKWSIWWGFPHTLPQKWSQWDFTWVLQTFQTCGGNTRGFFEWVVLGGGIKKVIRIRSR